MIKKTILAALALIAFLAAGCTMTGERLAADGVTEHQIVCGVGAPWSICESRAAEICSSGGYTTLSKTWSVDGSEMWVRCKS